MEQESKKKRLKRSMKRLIHWAKEFARAEDEYFREESGDNNSECLEKPFHKRVR